MTGLDSGYGSVGRVVTSDTSGPQFESRHQQNFKYPMCWKDENKVKEAGLT